MEIDDKVKHGNVTEEHIALFKKHKPEYSIARFISGDMPFGSSIEGLIMYNVDVMLGLDVSSDD